MIMLFQPMMVALQFWATEVKSKLDTEYSHDNVKLIAFRIQQIVFMQNLEHLVLIFKLGHYRRAGLLAK